MRKRGKRKGKKKISIGIIIILVVLVLLIIIFVGKLFISEKVKDVWGELRGELAARALRPPIRQVSCTLGSEEIAVKALLDYVGADSSFCSLDELTELQKQEVRRALDLLKGKNFVVFNRKVEVLSEGDVRVYNENNKVYLEIRDKGRVLLKDLSWMDQKRDCNKYFKKRNERDDFMYVMCYIDNYARQNPNVFIGEDENLVSYIEEYLRKNIRDFDKRFEFSASSSEIMVNPRDNSEIGIFVSKPIWTYDKDSFIFILRMYEDFIFDYDTEDFFIIGEGISERITKTAVYNILSESGSSITGKAISGDVPAIGAPVFADIGCNTTGHIPCNNQIDVFLGLCAEEGSSEVCDLTESVLSDFVKLGYNLKMHRVETKEEKMNVTWIENLTRSKGEILYTSFHGSSSGLIGPVECIENDTTKINARIAQLNNSFPGIDECIKRGYADENSSCPDVAASGNAIVELFLDMPCLKGLNILDEKALHASGVCHGERSLFPTISWFARNRGLIAWPHLTLYDWSLLRVYLIGWGPEPEDYLGNSNSSDEYPPNPNLTHIHNVNVYDVEDYGAAEYINIEITQNISDEINKSKGCFSKTTGFIIPCTLNAEDDRRIRLFPYVSSINFEKLRTIDFPNPIYYLSVLFSDDVKKPTVEFIVSNGAKKVNALEKFLVEENDTIFIYKFFSEVEPLNRGVWDGLSIFQKSVVLGANINISGARANLARNPVYMVGNPAALVTALNVSHGIAYFLYDPHFWMYNARYLFHSKTFLARVPYMLHPWVGESSTIFGKENIVFSHPVKKGNINMQFLTSGDYLIGSSDYIRFEVGDACLLSDEGGIFKKGHEPNFTKFNIREEDNFYNGINWEFNENLSILLERPEKNNYNNHKAVKIKVKSNKIKSDPNEFSLMGNTVPPAKSPLKWAYDSDENGEEDAWERNSHKIPQARGDFEIWYVCQGHDCDGCEEGNSEGNPERWGDGETPEFIKVTFTGITNCYAYGAPAPPNGKEFVLKQTASCMWRYSDKTWNIVLFMWRDGGSMLGLSGYSSELGGGWNYYFEYGPPCPNLLKNSVCSCGEICGGYPYPDTSLAAGQGGQAKISW